MIPKIIHYCWFGGSEPPKLMKKCLKSWQNKMPDYEIRLWSEETFNIPTSIPYVKEAYNEKKYAFVSDYVRLYALYNYGGVYLDTDVEVIKDFSELLKTESILGFEDKGRISTAFIAIEPHAEWIKEILDLYAERHFINEKGQRDQMTNVEFISRYLKESGVSLDVDYVKESNLTIYPVEYFSPRSWGSGKYNITNKTYTIHYFAGTWHSVWVKLLSSVFSNDSIIKIASVKEKILRIFR